MLSDLGLDFLVRLDGSRFAHHHPSPDVLPLQPSDQSAHVVSGLCPIQRLVEHLDTWAEQGGQQQGETPVYTLALVGYYITQKHFQIRNSSFMHVRTLFLSLSIYKVLEDTDTENLKIKPTMVSQQGVGLLSSLYLSCFAIFHSPVTTDLTQRLWPTNSQSSPFLRMPLSIAPVTTVPLPERQDNW